MPRTKAATRGSGLDISKASLALQEVRTQQQGPTLAGPIGVAAQTPVSEISKEETTRLQGEADFFMTRYAVNKTTEKIDNIMSSQQSGDPDKPGLIGLMLRKGENSFGTEKEFNRKMDDLKFEQEKGLQNRQQRAMFADKFSKIRDGQYNQLKQHNRYEWNNYKKDTYANDLKWTISTIAEHASNPTNVRLGMEDLETVIREYHDVNNFFGSSKESFRQILRQHQEEAASIVIEKNLLEISNPSGIDSLEALDQALNSYEILEKNYLGDTYGGGLSVYLPREKASKMLNKIMKVKNDLQAKKIEINIMKGGDRAIESKIDDGASMGTVMKEVEQQVRETQTDTTGDLAFDLEIKEDALDMARNDIKERFAFNRKVKNANKIDLLESVNEVLNDPKQTNKVGAIEEIFKTQDDAIKTEAQKPRPTYLQKEKLKSMGSDQDAGFPFASDLETLISIRTAILQGENMGLIAQNLLFAVDQGLLSKRDTLSFLSSGIRAQNRIDNKKPKVLPRVKSIHSREYVKIAKTYFPFFKFKKLSDPKKFQSYLSARLQTTYPGESIDEIQKHPDYTMTVQAIAKKYALNEIQEQALPLVDDGPMSQGQLRVLTGNLGFVDISASTTEGIKKKYLELISKGINLLDFAADKVRVDPEIEKINKLHKRGRISDMQAITYYWKNYYIQQKKLYIEEDSKK